MLLVSLLLELENEVGGDLRPILPPPLQAVFVPWGFGDLGSSQGWQEVVLRCPAGAGERKPGSQVQGTVVGAEGAVGTEGAGVRFHLCRGGRPALRAMIGVQQPSLLFIDTCCMSGWARGGVLHVSRTVWGPQTVNL